MKHIIENINIETTQNSEEPNVQEPGEVSSENNLQIDIAENSPISNASPQSIGSINETITTSTINATNRRCGICREIGHTRTKCPKAAFTFEF